MILKYNNWSDCSFEDYKTCCDKYGFNAESSPNHLAFMIKHGAKLKFIAYKKRGLTLGAACIDGDWLANDGKNPNKSFSNFVIPNNSVLVPIDSRITCLAPFKTKSLSPCSQNIINSSHRMFSKRELAITKDISSFSKKTVSTRKREMNKFKKDGGNFVSCINLDAETLLNIYESLYLKRRGENLIDRDVSLDFFKQFHANFFGEVLFLHDEPVCIQLLLSTHSPAYWHIDFINIGYDTSIKKHPLGTIAMWKNLSAASETSKVAGDVLSFSFGKMSGDYKKRWCTPKRIGRTIVI